jgi:hypothetical protein
MEQADRSNMAKLFGIGFVFAVLTLAAMLALPHDPFVRWQAVRTEAYARLGWAYERIHYDRTPIDIAFIGTSHTMNGIDAQAVADEVAGKGIRSPGGRCLTATNFSIPSYGRNLHWSIARELLETRRPGTLVIEVLENETRKPHPLFSHIATERDIITAPKLININYLADLIRLPYRQLSLFVESVAPSQFGLKAGFDPARYDGSTVDNTHMVNVDGKALTPPLTRVMDPEKLDKEAAGLRAAKDLNMLPERLAAYEYAVPRAYVDKILALARQTGTRVYLLYLPGYGKPPRPFDMSFYPADIKMLSLNDLLAERAYWHDVHHVNAQGAAVVSRRIGDLLAGERDLRASIEAAPRKGTTGCDWGYQPHMQLESFRPLSGHRP